MADGTADVVFGLGVSADELAAHVAPDDHIFSDTLTLEAAWRLRGGHCRYLYRDCTPVFERAAAAALAWLEQLPSQLRASGAEFAEVQSEGQLPLWTLGQDAIFEIKGGLFEGILHAFLVRDILVRHAGAPVRIVAAVGHPLAQGIAAWTAGELRLLPVSSAATASAPAARPPALWLRLWNATDTLVVSPLLVRLGRLFSPRNRSALAIVNSLGDMTRRFTDTRGEYRLGDGYFEGIEPDLSEAHPGLLKIGINPPRLAPGALRNQWLTWRALLSGEYRPWYFYATARDFWRHGVDLRHYAALLSRSDADDRFRRLFRVDGLDFYALVRDRMQSLLPAVLASMRLHHCIAQRLVAREGLRLVVSAEAFSNIGRCMAAALHRAGGQLFGVQAGIMTPQRVTNLGFYVPALAGHDEFIPDRFFAWGVRYATLLAGYGVPAHRLDVMGFNRAKPRLPASVGEARTILYVTGGNALVCPYLMTLDEERLTLEALATHLPPRAELVVRTHPRHRLEDFHWLPARHARVRLCAGADLPLETSLREADCVVGKASTVLLEAASAGKRVLLVNLAGTPEFTGFVDGAGGLPCVTDATKLGLALEQLLAQAPRVDEFVQAWCSGFASEAAQRFLQEVAQATRGRS